MTQKCEDASRQCFHSQSCEIIVFLSQILLILLWPSILSWSFLKLHTVSINWVFPVSFGCDLIFCPGNLIACQFSSLQLSLSFRTPSHLSRFPPASSSRAPTWPSSGQEQIKEAAGKLMKRIQEPQGSCQSPASLETKSYRKDTVAFGLSWNFIKQGGLLAEDDLTLYTESDRWETKRLRDNRVTAESNSAQSQQAPLHWIEGAAGSSLAVPLREKRCEPRSQTPQALPGASPRRGQNAGEGVLCRVYEIGQTRGRSALKVPLNHKILTEKEPSEYALTLVFFI